VNSDWGLALQSDTFHSLCGGKGLRITKFARIWKTAQFVNIVLQSVPSFASPMLVQFDIISKLQVYDRQTVLCCARGETAEPLLRTPFLPTDILHRRSNGNHYAMTSCQLFVKQKGPVTRKRAFKG